MCILKQKFYIIVFRFTKLISFFFIFFLLHNSYASNNIIEKIIIKNNKRILSATILSHVDYVIGQEYHQDLDHEVLSSLYATNFFSNLSINFNNGVLEIDAKEANVINKIYFSGNNNIKSSDLLKIIGSKEGSGQLKSLLDQDVKNIIRYYNAQGIYLLSVIPNIVDIGNNRVELEFKIIEGNTAKIKNIFFIGNHSVSSDILLKKINSSSNWIHGFFTKSNVYNPVRLSSDIDNLVRYYKSKGYFNVTIDSVIAELSVKKDSFDLIYHINESSQYRFGDIKIINDISDVKINIVNNIFKRGDIYNIELVDKYKKEILNFLSKLCGDHYYIIVKEKVDENGYVDISFVVKKIDLKHINKINISGNNKTHDHVIRREFLFPEDSVVSDVLINDSIKNINNLGFFNIPISYNLTPNIVGNSSSYDINLKVEEKSTRQGFGSVGYSTSDGFLGSLELSESNFLGRGNSINGSFKKSSVKSDYLLNYNHQYFLGYDISLGLNIFKSISNSSNYNILPYKENSHSIGPVIKFNIASNTDLSLSYILKYSDISINYDRVQNNPSQSLREQEGSWRSNVFITKITHNRLDNIVKPNSGFLLSYVTSIHNVHNREDSNKDISFWKNELSFKRFMPLLQDKVQWQLSADYGYIIENKDSNLRIIDRFSLGEPKLRGFKSNGVGPRDLRDPLNGLGGINYYSISNEFITSIKQTKSLEISGCAFVDMGSLHNINIDGNDNQIISDHYLRMSVGLGVILDTPIAPIRVYWAFPIRKHEYDRTQSISFVFGSRL